jgi:hypothetical protein
MFRRTHYCAFIIGAVLLLLAVVLVVNFESTSSPTPAHQVQHAYVAQAVGYLESGCLTCHASVNTLPQIEQAYTQTGLLDRNPNGEQTPVYYSPSNITRESTIVSLLLQDQLHTQLIETGQRILHLPHMQNRRAETAVEEYLHVYTLATAAPDQHTTQWALWQLEGLENLLRTLENQASPYQLARQDNPPTQAGSAVLHMLTTTPGVALVTQNVSMGEVIQLKVARLDTAPLAMPQEIVYATHRRGPPADAYLDSVL